MVRRNRTTSTDGSLFEDLESGSSDHRARSGDGAGSGNGQVVALHETARSKYLNYALSVITSRALPDVRDGLKPVQRRILYTMGQLRLTFDAKPRKCSTVVGMVMGNYHPHGDQAIYDALVRMAQPFSLRIGLIDGSGNFGSLDGDPAAAMRYTECRLAPIADEMLAEIAQGTVHFRPNYDGTKSEPVVLPARIPNLMLNGATGIAVGMATSIPPHNLGEICKALFKLLDNPELKTDQLLGKSAIQGPDFPTGGQILNTADQIREIYKSGAGTIRLRATWEKGPITRSGKHIYITSVPYGVNKSQLVERIGDIVLSRKLPPLLNVRDISTDDVRIELELNKGADTELVLAYLFKHTPLQSNFNVNLTCLVPTENLEVGRPERCDLKTILWHFLHFRLEVVTRRLEHELGQLNKRIHILEGFEIVFDALDQIIRIIRGSDGKPDAAKKIIGKFDLDAEQTDAVLELKLYRLAKLEVLVIRQELEDKHKRVRQITQLLKDEEDRWGIVRDQIKQVRDKYGKDSDHQRQTQLAPTVEQTQFSDDDFIIAEDNVVIVTRDGWVKRQKEVRDLSTQRLREGDSILTAQSGSTRATIAFFSSFGTAYTCRIIDIPATTGFGEPIQKLFKLKDGESIIQAVSLDQRSIGEIRESASDLPPQIHALAVTSDGYSLRFSLAPFVEVSTRNGRRYARPAGGAQVIGMHVIDGSERVIVATHKTRALLCNAAEINYLAGPGRGVILIKVAKDDRVIGCIASTGDRHLLTVQTNRGATKTISSAKYEITGRGGKGREIQKNGTIIGVVDQEPLMPVTLDEP